MTTSADGAALTFWAGNATVIVVLRGMSILGAAELPGRALGSPAMNDGGWVVPMASESAPNGMLGVAVTSTLLRPLFAMADQQVR